MPARRILSFSALDGETADERKILNAVDDVTAAPSTSSDGYALSGSEYVHLLWNVGGTTPSFSVSAFVYSAVSGQWHRRATYTITADTTDLLQVQGQDRIFLQVTAAPTGTTPTLDAWIALTRPA